MALTTSKFRQDFELGCRTGGPTRTSRRSKSRTPELLNF
jgi:hypothetical protein